MLLAVDIGNTHTAIGIFDGTKLVADWRIASFGRRTEDEIWVAVKGLSGDAGITPSQIDTVGIASVVPDLTDVYAWMADKYFHVTPILVTAALDLGIRIEYRDPMAVGADRLCNAVAGFARYGGPLIIIDFGTATTYDVVSAQGNYLGGVIALGLESEAAELHRRAAKLPRIDLHFPASVIGKDTPSSMQSGIMFGGVDAMEGIVRRIRKELGADAPVVATGGLGRTIGRFSAVIDHYEPSLVLEGIRLICARVRKA